MMELYGQMKWMLIIDDWYQNQDGSWNYYKKDFIRAEDEVVENMATILFGFRWDSSN